MSKRTDVSQLHDKSFKEFYRRPEAMIDLLENMVGLYLGRPLTEQDLTLIESSTHDINLKEQRSDVVYLVKVDDYEILVYLFLELQSSIDFRMPARLLFLMVEQLRSYYLNQNFSAKNSKIGLPAVFPIVLYNGDKPWNVSTQLRSIFNHEELFGDFLLNFTYAIIDINHAYGKEELRSKHNLNSIMFYLEQKSTPEEFLSRINDIVHAYSRLPKNQQDILRTWIGTTYEACMAQPALDLLSKQKVGLSVISNNATMVRDWKEKVRAEGREEGLEEGRQEGRQEGREEGRAEGVEEGIQRGMVKSIKRQLNKKFNVIPEELEQQLSLCSVEVLEEILDELPDIKDLSDLNRFFN